jgi:hypothetical protein
VVGGEKRDDAAAGQPLGDRHVEVTALPEHLLAPPDPASGASDVAARSCAWRSATAVRRAARRPGRCSPDRDANRVQDDNRQPGQVNNAIESSLRSTSRKVNNRRVRPGRQGARSRFPVRRRKPLGGSPQQALAVTVAHRARPAQPDVLVVTTARERVTEQGTKPVWRRGRGAGPPSVPDARA